MEIITDEVFVDSDNSEENIISETKETSIILNFFCKWSYQFFLFFSTLLFLGFTTLLPLTIIYGDIDYMFGLNQIIKYGSIIIINC